MFLWRTLSGKSLATAMAKANKNKAKPAPAAKPDLQVVPSKPVLQTK